MQRPCADVNSPYKRKCWTNSVGPLVYSLLWAPGYPPRLPSTLLHIATIPHPHLEMLDLLYPLYLLWFVQYTQYLVTPPNWSLYPPPSCCSAPPPPPPELCGLVKSQLYRSLYLLNSASSHSDALKGPMRQIIMPRKWFHWLDLW